MAKKPPATHVLVLVDGTESSFRASELTISLAHAVGARVTALAVVDVETLKQLLSVQILVAAEMEEIEQEMEENARRHLAEVHDHGMDQHVKIEEVMIPGNTEEVVPKEVQGRGIDLIVMGGFESSKVRHDLIARQRLHIVDRATCPVIVVP